MGVRAAIAGASGYAGGELLRILLDHPRMEIGPVTAGSHAGHAVTAVHPHLPGLAGRQFGHTRPEELRSADVVFLALPHGESAAIAAELPPGLPLVDLGADHRLADPGAWEVYYGTSHADNWPYGLPELAGARERLAQTRRVANPGCYATAVTLAFAPVLRAGLNGSADFVAMAASGTTGAGRSAKTHLLGSEVMGSLSPYKVAGAHQHTPEIEQALAEVIHKPASALRLSLTPVLAPMPRGILATCSVPVVDGATTEGLRAAFTEAYNDEAFVHLLDADVWPRTADTVGSNAAHVQVALDSHAHRAVAVCAIDNLGKGAAGQAVQNANLLLGLDETDGLTVQGMAP